MVIFAPIIIGLILGAFAGVGIVALRACGVSKQVCDGLWAVTFIVFVIFLVVVFGMKHDTTPPTPHYDLPHYSQRELDAFQEQLRMHERNQNINH